MRTKNSQTIYVSEPYRANSGAWAVNISRALFDESSHFRGALVATLDPEYFLGSMKQLLYADDVFVTLIHSSGQTYVSSQQSMTAVHAAVSRADGLLQRHRESGQGAVSVAMEEDPDATADGRLISVASTVGLTDVGTDGDFVAVAGRSQRLVLAHWTRNASVLALMFGFLMVASGVALHFYQRWARQVRAQVQEAAQELVQLAYHDPLTDAFNRRAFLTSLNQEFERTHRYSSPCCLLMLDLDHFKAVNDRYGHDCGDLVLKHVVERLQSHLRAVDTLGRLGGEEFAVLLPSTQRSAAVELAERLRSMVEQSVLLLPVTEGAGQPFSITISIGVTTLLPGEAGETVGEVLKRVDQAMCNAKASGRNRVCWA